MVLLALLVPFVVGQAFGLMLDADGPVKAYHAIPEGEIQRIEASSDLSVNPAKLGSGTHEIHRIMLDVWSTGRRG